ncbi:hypothetical protein [Blastococcus sp. CCUG 61487]|uniref:hypothetical protein n=1 Tax=Blastococcus sp. CCUG 61487 TaxID=1840703 RepID=UPI00113DD65E|nr:hypothetical protein [Blastococcus sp. CCUG 61487]TKJ20202.1 hypothetical protein A6V29_09130 [Blastococcus sp. CCUG 61487]
MRAPAGSSGQVSPATSKCIRFLTVFRSGTGTIHISGPSPAGSTIGIGQSCGRGSASSGVLERVAAHVTDRGAPPVSHRLVVVRVEAQVLEAWVRQP